MFWLQLIVYLGPAVVLIIWAIRYQFGRTALNDRPRHRYHIDPVQLGLVVMAFFCLGFVIQLAHMVGSKFMVLPAVKDSPLSAQLHHAVSMTGGVIIVLIAAGTSFERGIRGLGVTSQRLGRDLFVALAALWAAFPICQTILVLTIFFLHWLKPDFEFAPHETLQALLATPSLLGRILLVLTVVVVVPIGEEIFFRGYLQRFIGEWVRSPWISIFLTSGLFATAHFAQPVAIVPLFVFSLFLGYLMEKTGRLTAPVALHAMFNLTMVAATMMIGEGR